MKPLPSFHHYDTRGTRRDFGTLDRREAAALLREWRRTPLDIPRIERTPTHRQYALTSPGGSLLTLLTFSPRALH